MSPRRYIGAELYFSEYFVFVFTNFSLTATRYEVGEGSWNYWAAGNRDPVRRTETEGRLIGEIAKSPAAIKSEDLHRNRIWEITTTLPTLLVTRTPPKKNRLPHSYISEISFVHLLWWTLGRNLNLENRFRSHTDRHVFSSHLLNAPPVICTPLTGHVPNFQPLNPGWGVRAVLTANRFSGRKRSFTRLSPPQLLRTNT